MGAVRVASLGQIAKALYEVGGEYRRNLDRSTKNHSRTGALCGGAMRSLLVPSFVVFGMVHSQLAEAACEISDFGPTAALPTQRVGQSFGFVATTDCRSLTFLATSVRLSKTPTPGALLGTNRQRYHVELSEAEWRQVSQPRVERFNWVVYERGVGGRPLVSNEIDSDQDGWTRTDGDLAACDFDPARNPGLIDVMGNGVDDDCDGGVDNTRFEDPVAEIVAPTSYRPAIGDLDGDGITDFAFGSTYGGGDVYVAYGPTHGSVNALDFSALVGTTSDHIGQSVSIGDANGDGIGDLATIHTLGDRAYLFLGPVTAERSLADADAFFDVPSSGPDLDIVPDFDGDGTGDVVVGSPGGRPYPWAVYVGSGSSTGTVDLETSATYTFLGTDLGFYDFAIGDATGDGIADLALREGDTGAGGIVYLVEGGTAPGTYDVASAAWAAIDDAGGQGIASGDYDGDGALDIITGDIWGGSGDELYFGAAYAFLGPFSGTTSSDDAVATWTGLGYLDKTGEDVAAGDVDGDGSLDVLIGAPEEDSGAGAVYLQLGFVSGSVSVSSLPTFSPYVRDVPAASWGNAGAYVNAIPDWEGDGGAEVAISSGNGGAMVVYESDALF